MNGDIVTPEEKIIYLKSQDSFVVSDLHLGVTYPDKPYPVMEHEAVHERLINSVENHQPSEIIFNGDIFSTKNADDYWVDMFSEFNSLVDELVFNIGNHEEKNGGFPKFVAEDYKVEMSVKRGEYLIHHGHRTPTIKSEINIIGHLHPTLEGKDVLLEKENAYYTTDVVVMPVFSDIVNGVDVHNQTPKGHCPIIDDGAELRTYSIIKEYN